MVKRTDVKQRRIDRQTKAQQRNRLIVMSGELTPWQTSKALRYERRHPGKMWSPYTHEQPLWLVS